MVPLFRVAVRQLSTSTVARSGNVPAGYNALKQKQKMFNLDNGLRVHERGGFGDTVLYNTCLGLIVVGGALWVQTVYELAFPKR